jgi:hypothetical protein
MSTFVMCSAREYALGGTEAARVVRDGFGAHQELRSCEMNLSSAFNENAMHAIEKVCRKPPRTRDDRHQVCVVATRC